MTQTATTAPKTWNGFGPSSSLVSIACMPSSKRRDWLRSLSKDELHQAHQVRFGLHDHQVPSHFDWRTWLLLGGRGAGKTFAGATWITQLARTENLNLALVGPTLHDVREVMVEGPSGLKAMAEDDFRPRWEAGRRRLVWPSGTRAYAFSAEDPDSLRGPQFHHAWADEFCAWKKPQAVLDMLRLALRLGDNPRLLVTTTPRPLPALKRLLDESGTRCDRAPTEANAGNLSARFLTYLRELYAGTRLEAQELDGMIVEAEGALFRAEDLARARGSRPVRLDKIVVAVDPPASAGGDACGIVVAGRRDDRAYVLADRSERGLSPLGWGRKVAETVEAFGAHQVVAEANQGGEMVSTILAQAGCPVPVKRLYASRSKAARAEPVAALYEQGRVIHCGAFPALEEELMALGGEGGPSPDRADALVWAVTHLLLDGRGQGPRLRAL